MGIKVKGKTFEIIMPNFPDKSITEMLNNWGKLIEQQKSSEDVYTIIPELPQYKFKNLKIEQAPFEITDEKIEATLTFKYDDFDKIE